MKTTPPPHNKSPLQIKPWVALTAVCAALLVVVVDVTVLHVAAPAISAALAPTSVELLWIIDVYPLVVAPLLLVVGVAGDKLGRKRVLLLGLALFGILSIPAAFASSALMLIIARGLMGIGAALIMPSTMSIVRAVFPDRRKRIRAVGIWSAVAAAGAAAGPLIGGILVENFWWGAVFLINVPFAIAVLIFAWRVLPESRSTVVTPWDFLSVILAVLSVFALVFGIKEFARHGIDISSSTSFVIAAAGTIWFVARQRHHLTRGRQPLLNIRLFHSPVFTLAVISVLLSMFGIVGLDLFFAQYLQNILGFKPVEAALRIMPMAAATIIGSLCAAFIIRTFGTRFAIAAGLGTAAAALIPLLTLGPVEQLVLFTICLALIGFALEIALVAANDVIISAVPLNNAGEAAGIEETAYELGGGLGVAILGSALAATYAAALPAIPGLSPEQLITARESLTGAEKIAAQSPGTLGDQLTMAAHSAFISGLHVALIISIAIIAIAAVAAAILLKAPPTEQENDEASAAAPHA